MYLTINLYLFRKLKVSVLFTCTVGNPVITNIVPDFSRDKETLHEGIFRELQSYMSYSDPHWYPLDLEEETVIFLAGKDMNFVNFLPCLCCTNQSINFQMEKHGYFYQFAQTKVFRAKNFRILDIKINAWSPLFINLKMNSIFSL